MTNQGHPYLLVLALSITAIFRCVILSDLKIKEQFLKTYQNIHKLKIFSVMLPTDSHDVDGNLTMGMINWITSRRKILLPRRQNFAGESIKNF